MIAYEQTITLADGTKIELTGCEACLSLAVYGLDDNGGVARKPQSLHLNIFDVGRLTGNMESWAKEWLPEAVEALAQEENKK